MLEKSSTSRVRTFDLAPMAAAALALLVSGCSFIPTYERPAAPVAVSLDMAGAVVDPKALAIDMPWRDFVQDPRLRDLIALALENNRDFRVATLNIEQVRAQYQIQRAGLLPAVNAAVTGSRQSSTDDTITGVYTAGLAMSGWEVDFFGRIASLKEAALAQFLASEEARNSARTSLVAAVASSWLSLQTSDELLALTEQTLKTRQDSLRLTQLRFDSGVSSALDLRQAESLLASAQGALAQQQRLRAFDLNALTLLAGLSIPPSLLPISGGSTQPFATVAAGLSSEVLILRADIRAAEQQLIAANANIGAARAAFFPRISLTASLGTASDELSGLFKSGSWGFTLSPQALLPVFDAGRNRAGLQVAQTQRSIAVVQYEKAIQTAFREVTDALAGRATLTRQALALQAQAEAESERFRLSELRYSNGIASFLDVLDAQRSLFATQQALGQARLAQRQNQVALYKALGGGWRE